MRRARWANLLVVNLRLLLGFAFVPAGLKKVLGERFTDPSNTGPFHEFLHAFYATGFFYSFVGAVQLLVALLLMTQVYGTLGALMAVPLFTAISVLCWSTGAVFTGVMTTLMLLGSVALCAWDVGAFRGVLRPGRPASAADACARDQPQGPAGVASAPPIDLQLWSRTGLAVLLVYFGACALYGGVYRPRGVELGNPAFYVLPLVALLPLGAWWWERRRPGTRAPDQRGRGA